MDSIHICTSSTQRGAYASRRRGGWGAGQNSPRGPPSRACSMETPSQSVGDWKMNGLVFY